MPEYVALAIPRSRTPRWDYAKKAVTQYGNSNLAEIVQNNLNAFGDDFYWTTKKIVPHRRQKELEVETAKVREYLLNAIDLLEDGWFARTKEIARFDFVGLSILVTGNIDDNAREILAFQVLKSSGIAHVLIGFDA